MATQVSTAKSGPKRSAHKARKTHADHERIFRDARKTFKEGEKNFLELLAVLGDALTFFPPLYVDSILGHPWTWIPPHDKTSEFNMINVRQVARSLRYLSEVTIPAVPLQLPEFLPGFGDAIFWRPTEIYFEPDDHDDPYSYPEEAWIFVNGIATNADLARVNAEYLVSMFHRPLTVIQNATDSISIDLFECLLGKAWSVQTEAAAKAYPFILHALEHADKRRVVVICHSQGTIITSNVLRALVDDEYREFLNDSLRRMPRIAEEKELKPLKNRRDLEKLEIYAFANCATTMPQDPGVKTAKGNPIPWIENFGNQYDLVARCGMLAPKKDERGIEIAGANYVRDGMWGHCLNLHYLKSIHDHLKKPDSKKNPYVLREKGSDHDHPSRPRLYEYWDGQVPESY